MECPIAPPHVGNLLTRAWELSGEVLGYVDVDSLAIAARSARHPHGLLHAALAARLLCDCGSPLPGSEAGSPPATGSALAAARALTPHAADAGGVTECKNWARCARCSTVHCTQCALRGAATPACARCGQGGCVSRGCEPRAFCEGCCAPLCAPCALQCAHCARVYCGSCVDAAGGTCARGYAECARGGGLATMVAAPPSQFFRDDAWHQQRLDRRRDRRRAPLRAPVDPFGGATAALGHDARPRQQAFLLDYFVALGSS